MQLKSYQVLIMMIMFNYYCYDKDIESFPWYGRDMQERFASKKYSKVQHTVIMIT